jgi:phosphomethylpyrimidine synthase
MTRIELAKKGIITEEMREVAMSEGIKPEILAFDIAEGVTVISKNTIHNIKPIGIGRGLRTKVNANMGTSKDKVSFDEELLLQRLMGQSQR